MPLKSSIIYFQLQHVHAGTFSTDTLILFSKKKMISNSSLSVSQTMCINIYRIHIDLLFSSCESIFATIRMKKELIRAGTSGALFEKSTAFFLGISQSFRSTNFFLSKLPRADLNFLAQ